MSVRMADVVAGIRKNGVVVHYSTNGQTSLCGRYMSAGEGVGRRACKSCVRVGKLVVTTVERTLREIVDASYLASRADEFIAKRRDWSDLQILRDVVADWEEGEYAGDVKQEAYVALCRLALEYRTLKADAARPVERKADMVRGDGMVNPNSTSVAKRGNLTENQRNALIKMSNFENALILEIRQLEGKETPELSVLDDEYFATLKTRTMVDKLFTSLSASIDKLKTQRDALRRTATAATPAKPASESITEGMYRVGERVFKVKPTQVGRLWAHELMGSTEDGYRFEFAGKPSQFVKPEHRMTLEEAKEFGRVTGTCCVCGRLLTKQKSIDDGIGPVCGGNV